MLRAMFCYFLYFTVNADSLFAIVGTFKFNVNVDSLIMYVTELLMFFGSFGPL